MEAVMNGWLRLYDWSHGLLYLRGMDICQKRGRWGYILHSMRWSTYIMIYLVLVKTDRTEDFGHFRTWQRVKWGGGEAYTLWCVSEAQTQDTAFSYYESVHCNSSPSKWMAHQSSSPSVILYSEMNDSPMSIWTRWGPTEMIPSLPSPREIDGK